ncbi:hypothetical protein Trydic_g13331 [Trypoxylus dichotomus]
MRNVVVIFVILAALVGQNMYKCESFRVLGLFPLPIKSHFIFYQRFMKELASKGHQVYVVSQYPEKFPPPNYYDIDINGSLSRSIGQLSVQFQLYRGIIGIMKYIFRSCGSEICEHLFQHRSIIELRNSTLKFDVVIAELYGTDCLLGFAHHFGAPIIGMSGTDLLPWAAARMGNPDNPSYVPNYFLAVNEQMVLYEKLQAFFALFLTKIGYFFLSTAASEIRAREFFGNQLPSLEAIVSNTSLLLVNSHLSVNVPRPMVPNVIEVGGLHIQPSDMLSWELDKIVKTSPEGVIYFSMGTVIDLKTFEINILQVILNAFSKIPQAVIWSGIVENVTFPENVFVFPWVEQIELLCEPHLKAFVTNGGLMSLQEAAYCGVPILGVSIFPNHKRNINKYVNNGAGLLINYDDLTEEVMLNSLNDLIGNASYKENAARLSMIFKTRPMSALDTAVYWTEYVVKFGGAQHMRSKSADLVWFEYYLVDCIIILMLLMSLGILTTVASIHVLQNYVDDVWFYNAIKIPNKEDEQTQIEQENKDK